MDLYITAQLHGIFCKTVSTMKLDLCLGLKASRNGVQEAFKNLASSCGVTGFL